MREPFFHAIPSIWIGESPRQVTSYFASRCVMNLPYECARRQRYDDHPRMGGHPTNSQARQIQIMLNLNPQLVA